MLDQKILSAAASSRQAADELATLEIEKDLAEAPKVLLQEIMHFYEIDSTAERVEKPILLERLRSKFPKQDHFEQFAAILKNISHVSAPNVLELVRDLRLDTISQEIAVAFIDHKYSKVDTLLEKYNKLRSGTQLDLEEGMHFAPSLEELAAEGNNESPILVFPKSLNDALGGNFIRGNHMFLFGRPETGKTAVSLTLCYGFLRHNHKVLYLANEEPHIQILKRLMARMNDKPYDWVKANPFEATAGAKKRGYLPENMMLWQPDQGGSLAGLQKRAERFKPDVVIVDQLRNMEAPGDSEHTKYEHLGKKIRDLAKQYNFAAVTIGQAGAEAEDKAVLSMNDVYGSKTGLQGATDVMIGVGCTEEMKTRGEIVMTPVKNKLNGNHRPFKLRIDKSRSKIY